MGISPQQNDWQDKVSEITMSEQQLAEAMHGLSHATALAFSTATISCDDIRAVIHTAANRWWTANPDLHTGTLATRDMVETRMKEAIAKAAKIKPKELEQPSFDRLPMCWESRSSKYDGEFTWGKLYGLDLGAMSASVQQTIAELDFPGTGKALPSHAQIAPEVAAKLFPPQGAKGEEKEHDRIVTALNSELLPILGKLDVKLHLPAPGRPMVHDDAQGQRLTGIERHAREEEAVQASAKYNRHMRQREVFRETAILVKAGQNLGSTDGIRPYFEAYGRSGHAPQFTATQRCYVALKVVQGHHLNEQMSQNADKALAATPLLANGLNAVFVLTPGRSHAEHVCSEVLDLLAGPAKG